MIVYQTSEVGYAKCMAKASSKSRKDVVSLPVASRAPHVSFETDRGEEEHRGFPRALLQIPVRIWVGDVNNQRFKATLVSFNLSVSGSFLQSSFFLPLNTEVHVAFELGATEKVHARAEVIRDERSEKANRTGMAIRFLEFFDQSEVAMAKLFLGDLIRGFAGDYLNSARGKAAKNELDRVVDLLAAWELNRSNTPTDPWRQQSAAPSRR
jgi:hypothetical protein